MGKVKDKGYSKFRSDLNEFANICGLPGYAAKDFDRHVEVMIMRYYKK